MAWGSSTSTPYTPPPPPVQPAIASPTGAAPAAPNTFDLARKRAQQQASADAQKQTDAIQRRFASLGALGSGSSIKAQTQAQDQSNAQRDTTMEGINAAEAQDAAQKAEAQKNRDFQAEQAGIGRTFQSGEADKQRAFQAGQSNIDRAFQDKVFQFDSSSKLKQLDLALQEFNLNKDTLGFNKNLQLAQLDDEDAAKKYGLMPQFNQAQLAEAQAQIKKYGREIY